MVLPRPEAAELPIIDTRFVALRLEDAGRTLLALPNSGPSTRLRMSSLEIVRSAIEAYGWNEKRLRPPVPGPAAIDAMDEAYGWLGLIPEEKFPNYPFDKVGGK